MSRSDGARSDRRRSRRRAWALAAVPAIVFALAGCGGGDGGTSERNGLTTIKVQDTAGVPSAFLSYGVQKGFFRRHGLDVEVSPSQGGATVVPAVVSGNVDIGGSNVVSVLLARGKGIPIKVIAPGTFVQDDAQHDFSAILVSPKSGIRSPKQLEGKTLAVNTLQNVAELTAKASLAKRGVDVSKVKLTEIDFPDMVPALRQGRVDAIFAIEPFVTQGLADEDRALERPYVATKPGLQIGCYFTTERYLQQHGDVVSRFRAGVAETAQSIARDPAAFRATLPKTASLPAKTAKQIALPAWKAHSDPASVALQATLMQRYGIAKERPDVSDLLAEQ